MVVRVEILPLDQKPCVVHYLSEVDRFLVGTYELFTSIDEAKSKCYPYLNDCQVRKRLEDVNNRAGKFILIRENGAYGPIIEYGFDCHQGGGVFDANCTFVQREMSYLIYTAHSNGKLGVYKLSIDSAIEIRLQHLVNIEGSSMLTCVDFIHKSSDQVRLFEGSIADTSDLSDPKSTQPPVVPCPYRPLSKILVGDAEGFVSIINDGKVSRETVTRGDSIWQLRSLILTSGREIIMVAAEDSSWSIYELKNDDSLALLYSNLRRDFHAGVTCISTVGIKRFGDQDLVEVLVGSYDETIKIYHIELGQDLGSKPEVCHRSTIAVKGGGIWRVKICAIPNSSMQVYLAAMYAGSFSFSMDDFRSQSEKHSQAPSKYSLDELVDIGSLKMDQTPLHYDIDFSPTSKTCCIADFNNRACLLIPSK